MTDPKSDYDNDKKDILESFRMVMRFIADQRIEIETCKACLRSLGVTPPFYDAMQIEQKQRWNAQGESRIEDVQLRQWLESASGTKQ